MLDYLLAIFRNYLLGIWHMRKKGLGPHTLLTRSSSEMSENCVGHGFCGSRVVVVLARDTWEASSAIEAAIIS